LQQENLLRERHKHLLKPMIAVRMNRAYEITPGPILYVADKSPPVPARTAGRSQCEKPAVAPDTSRAVTGTQPA
jgi:hypothetical protein